MRRGGTWLALAGAVLALAACGGNGGDAAPDEPGLPPGLAERLAKESEAVADKLDAGDQCGAAQQADVLEDAVEQAIAEGNIPDPFQAELTAAAKKLQNEVNCPQPAPPPGKRDCEELEGQKNPSRPRRKRPKGRGEASSTSRSRSSTGAQGVQRATGTARAKTARETNERRDARRRPLWVRGTLGQGGMAAVYLAHDPSSTARSRSRCSPSICRATRPSVSASSAKRAWRRGSRTEHRGCTSTTRARRRAGRSS